MGKGTNDNMALGSECAPRDAGEIPLLDADRLDDKAGVATGLGEEESFGDPADDRALKIMIGKLRHFPKVQKLSDEQIADQAIDLYNRLCDRIRDGRATDEQVRQTAKMFGEDPEKLRERLTEPPEADADDQPADGGGVQSLLKALSSR